MPPVRGARAHGDDPFRIGHLVLNALDRQGHLVVTVPATIIRSDCRGEKRMTSEPNREISNRLAPAAINSMAQQASPIGMGHSGILAKPINGGVHAGDDDVALDF